MTITERDRRLLKLWAVVMGLGALYFAYELLPASSSTPVRADAETVGMAEQRLARLRDIAASTPAKQDVLKKVTSELNEREAGLIRTETVAQAQALVVTKVRELMLQEAPAIELRSVEIGAIEMLDDAYGLAPVTLNFECRLEQLINLLAAIETLPELITTRDYQISAANPKNKTVRVRLTVAGVVPKTLVPATAKKGAGL
jgi:hypothetical protein